MRVMFRAGVVLWYAGLGSAYAQEAPSAFQPMLTALGDPGDLVCQQGLLTPADQRSSADGKAVIAKVMSAPAYNLDFTEADGAHVSELLLGALAKSGGGADPTESEMFSPSNVYNSVILGNARYEVFPENAIDVTAIYLVLTWAAQEGDPIVKDGEKLTRIVGKVRDQVAMSEATCFVLGGKGDALRAERDLMLAREGMLFDALMRLEGPDADSLAAYIRETARRHIEGLVLGEGGFEKAP